jgi:hypothetical protein
MSAVLTWRRERLPMLLFGMLSVYLALAAAGVEDKLQVGALLLFAMQVLAAWCLVAAFRILDDIADLPRDLVRTPDRVLVGVSDLRPFWFAALGLLAIGSLILLVLTGWLGPALVIGLAACFGGFYRAGLGHREYWVLLKYPLFVIALGAEHWTTPVLLYLCFSIYEHIDDSALREAPGALLILIFHVLSAGLVTAIAVGNSWWWMPAWIAAAALSVLAQVRNWPALAPVFLIFSIFVFQGARHV